MLEGEKKLIPPDHSPQGNDLAEFSDHVPGLGHGFVITLDLQPPVTACNANTKSPLHESKQFLIAAVQSLQGTGIVEFQSNLFRES